MADIFVKSGYGGNTRQPFVSLAIGGGEFVQVLPDDARRIARQLFEAAEAAEQDGFLVEWTMQALDLEMAEAGGLLAEYREWREQRKAGEG